MEPGFAFLMIEFFWTRIGHPHKLSHGTGPGFVNFFLFILVGLLLQVHLKFNG